jgi:hypothetical protein
MNCKRFVMLLLCLAAVGGLWAQGKDFLFSLAVPGYSQISSGKNYGYAMLAAEAALIGTSYYLNSEANLLRDESYTYALKFAHITPGEYDTYFLKNLGKYNGSGFEADGYNATIRRDAQILYPDDPVAQQEYIDNHAYGDEHYWRWESASNRKDYNRMRNDALDLESYGKLVVGVIILNHLASGIDVLRSHAQERRTQLSVDIRYNVPILKLSLKF